MSVNYLDNPWKAKPYTLFKDQSLSDTVYELGYQVGETLPKETIKGLEDLFSETHNFEGNDKGGMFYSVYSQDLNYRRKIHDGISKLLQPFLDDFFCDYRVMITSFVVKVPGPNSEFYLHQDTTGLDEWKYSPMSLWIPLNDVDENSGCLGIIPKSHHFFSPYRSISFPAPFDSIQSTVKQYLQPLDMKKGEVLFFDNRMLHNSFINNSSKERVAVVCGIFPKEAKMQTIHKQEYKCGGQVEIIEQNDDFLFTYPNFLIDCQKRPHVGNSLGLVDDPYQEISIPEFEELCRKNGIQKRLNQIVEGEISCQMISEPQPVEPVQAEQPDKPEIARESFFKRLPKILGL